MSTDTKQFTGYTREQRAKMKSCVLELREAQKYLKRADHFMRWDDLFDMRHERAGVHNSIECLESELEYNGVFPDYDPDPDLRAVRCGRLMSLAEQFSHDSPNDLEIIRATLLELDLDPNELAERGIEFLQKLKQE